MTFYDLPKLGLGIAADIGATAPDLSKLLGKHGRFQYLNLGAHYNQLQRVRHYAGIFKDAGVPFIFHPIDFNTALWEPEPAEVVGGVREIVEWADAKWMGQDLGIWNWKGHYLGPFLVPPLLDADSAHDCAKKVSFLSELMPVSFLVENPPISFAMSPAMHILDFMKAVSIESGCGIVLDIGHLLGYHYALGSEWDSLPVDTFCWDRVVEVHLAGTKTSVVGETRTWNDSHGSPIREECWAFFEENISRMSNLKAVTLEQEFCPMALVLEHLDRADAIMSRGVALGR